MKCLENYTVEQVKMMSLEELKVLWQAMVNEKQETDMRATIVEIIEIRDAKKPIIEN